MPKGVYERKPRPPKRYPPDMVARVRELYESGMTQAEVAQEIGATQKVVWRLMKHHGIEARPAVMRDPPTGPYNPAWKGDAAGYQAMHVRVEKARGKPDLCERCGSEGEPSKVYEWANLSGDYADVNDYERMCRECHRQYDNERRGWAPCSRPDVTTEAVAKLRDAGLSINEIARRLDTSWPTVKDRLP